MAECIHRIWYNHSVSTKNWIYRREIKLDVSTVALEPYSCTWASSWRTSAAVDATLHNLGNDLMQIQQGTCCIQCCTQGKTLVKCPLCGYTCGQCTGLETRKLRADEVDSGLAESSKGPSSAQPRAAPTADTPKVETEAFTWFRKPWGALSSSLLHCEWNVAFTSSSHTSHTHRNLSGKEVRK